MVPAGPTTGRDQRVATELLDPAMKGSVGVSDRIQAAAGKAPAPTPDDGDPRRLVHGRLVYGRLGPDSGTAW